MISKTIKSHDQDDKLQLPLTTLKGIGPRRAELMAKKGLLTIFDLLFFTPIRYEDRRNITPIGQAEEGDAIVVRGHVVYGKEERLYGRRKSIFKIAIRDGDSLLELLWFHYKRPYLSSYARKGIELEVYGRIKLNRGKKQMIHPDVNLIQSSDKSAPPGILPFYSIITGMSQQVIRSLIGEALRNHVKHIVDLVPAKKLDDLDLPPLSDAIVSLHKPPPGIAFEKMNNRESVHHKRITFERFFRVMLNITLRKKFKEKRLGPVFSIPKDLKRSLRKYFPFDLTGDQLKVVDEILNDYKKGRVMNRLLQGDVGCGKTVVAVIAAYIAIRNRRQVAMMVPTQVLASQHYSYFSNLPSDMGFRPALLSGSLKRKERNEIYEKIRNGACDMVIGTHALIQEGVSFERLGLVIIDEQHRFGVRQRAMLDEKGENPHMLVMSATPIPRTLAMTVYADMDISTIREYPKGHLPVVTRLVKRSEKRAIYNIVKKRLSDREQALVICPVIERSEEQDLKNALEMYEKLEKIYSPKFKIGLIHGRMPLLEKDSVMEQFRNGDIDLLVGTTVVEVGIHAPEATVIVIEQPERFGLAQIHQLRGRVGRGAKQGLCLLVVSERISKETLPRLEILEKSSDGFEIAKKDLEMRGQGELTGLRQAGSGELIPGEIFKEPELLMSAKKAAEMVVEMK